MHKLTADEFKKLCRKSKYNRKTRCTDCGSPIICIMKGGRYAIKCSGCETTKEVKVQEIGPDILWDCIVRTASPSMEYNPVYAEGSPVLEKYRGGYRKKAIYE